jgi:hypothetical protein
VDLFGELKFPQTCNSQACQGTHTVHRVEDCDCTFQQVYDPKA